MTYGVSRQAEVSARDVRARRRWGRPTPACSGDAVLGTDRARPSPAHHNVLNSLAAVAVGLDLGVPFAAVKEGLAVVHRRRPPLPAPRRGGRRHRDRRLRPPPDGDPRHPRDPARPRGHAPHRRPVPAPPLHAHPAPVGRLLPRLPPGRPRRARRHLPRGRGADRGRSAPRPWPMRSAAGGIGRSCTAGTCARPSSTCWGRSVRATSSSPWARAACGRRATSCSGGAPRPAPRAEARRERAPRPARPAPTAAAGAAGRRAPAGRKRRSAFPSPRAPHAGPPPARAGPTA